MTPQPTLSKPLPRSDLAAVVAETRPLWEELRGRRLFVTGGTGFFGRWLVESFLLANRELRLGCELWILSRRPKNFVDEHPWLAGAPALKWVEGDVASFAFPALEFSHVIHAAAPTNWTWAALTPEAITHTLVDGTKRVTEFAKHCGARRLLLTSTGAVASGAARPEAPLGRVLTPAEAYSRGKQRAEELCGELHRASGCETVIARGFSFVGPALPSKGSYAVSSFIADALAGRPIRLTGDGTPVRSYLYASDLAIWVWTLLFRGRSFSPYNVGSETAISIADLARLIARELGSPHPIEIGAVGSAQQTALDHYVASTDTTRRELGLRETVTLADAIGRTAAWHRG